jgi:hypothetical protein
VLGVALREHQAESKGGDHLERAGTEAMELIEREVGSKNTGISVEELGPEGWVLGRVVDEPNQAYQVRFARGQDNSAVILSPGGCTCPRIA